MEHTTSNFHLDSLNGGGNGLHDFHAQGSGHIDVGHGSSVNIGGSISNYHGHVGAGGNLGFSTPIGDHSSVGANVFGNTAGNYGGGVTWSTTF